MKRAILTVILMALAGEAWCLWQGKLDLNSSVQPVALREVGDGQWLAGLSHPNLYHLDHNGNILFHLGVFSAWNAEHGNPSSGLIAGVDLLGLSKDLGYYLPKIIDQISSGLGLPSIFKPASYLASMLTLDTFVGYRPYHTPDVKGQMVYGLGASLNVPFGVKELTNGSMNDHG